MKQSSKSVDIQSPKSVTPATSDRAAYRCDNRAECASLREVQEQVQNSPRTVAQRFAIQEALHGTPTDLPENPAATLQRPASSANPLPPPDTNDNNTGLPDDLKSGI